MEGLPFKFFLPFLKVTPNILRAVNRHVIHQWVPCFWLEFCQQGILLGKVCEKLLDCSFADSLVVHLGADGIILGFGISNLLIDVFKKQFAKLNPDDAGNDEEILR